MSARRLLILIKGLAKDPASLLHRELNEGWSRVDHLMAAQLDELRLGNYFFGVANTPKGKPPPIADPPKQTPRPGVDPNAGTNTQTVGKTTLSPEEVKALLAQYDPPKE